MSRKKAYRPVIAMCSLKPDTVSKSYLVVLPLINSCGARWQADKTFVLDSDLSC